MTWPKDPATRADDAHYYGMLFGHAGAVEQALKTPHRTYTAAERAAIFNLTYGERQHLELRRTRWAGATAQDVERARRDRWNVKRRAARAKAARRTEIFKKVIASHGVNRPYQVPKANTLDLLSKNLGNLVAVSSNRSDSYPRTLINTYRKQQISIKPLRG